MIYFNPIQERREGVKVAKNVMFHLERSCSFFWFCFCFCIFGQWCLKKTEISSRGAYHHNHFVTLTSPGILLFHLTKKGIVIKKVKKDHCSYIHKHTHTHTSVNVLIVNAF